MRMAKGYANFILHIDLTTGEAKREPLAEELCRDFLGGFGVNNRLAYDLIPPGIDPLSPDNPVILGAGMLNGTQAPASSRFFATTKYPTTQAIGSASGGGFGFMLKAAGFDHVIIRGQASRPVVIKIIDNQLELENADDLWGKDIFETTDELWKRYGDESQVIALGPAGERLVKSSFCLVNKISTLGRGGLGAVLASKRVKAIVARGEKSISVQAPIAFAKKADALLQGLAGLPYRDSWLKYGPAVARFLAGRKGFLVKGFRELDLDEGLERTYGPEVYEALWQVARACPSCPVACKAIVKLADRALPFSAALAAAEIWGARFNMTSLEEAMACRDLCNRNGLDDRMASGLIEFAVDLYEASIIKQSDTDGMRLKRDPETVSCLLKMILNREGIGDMLAEGFGAVIARFGPQAKKYAVEIKGLDPYRDPRELFDGMAISQAVNPRGSYGVPGNSPAYLPGRKPDQFKRYLARLGVEENTRERICPEDGVNIARLTRYAEDWYSLCSCLGICVRQPVTQVYSLDDLAELYAAASGWNKTGQELMRAGERAWTVLKAANIREGFGRQDDRFPDVFFEPLIAGKKRVALRDYTNRALGRTEVERLFTDYYQERGWHPDTGLPTCAGLTDLGLGHMAEDLRRRGLI